jgi:hypothetical protein
MPSLREISACRSAHDTKAPVAQMVTSCQSPPASSGANRSPYLRSGGEMLICQRFHVGPCDAPQTRSSVPEHREEDGRHAEEADVERPDPEVEEVAADQRPAADAVFPFKAEHRHREVSGWSPCCRPAASVVRGQAA